MKNILLDYCNALAYTIIGLVFGFSFFLLFINFYHYQELDYSLDVTSYNATNKEEVLSKVQQIKDNISVYDQSTYNGNLNIYGLNAVKLKLSSCIEIIESEEILRMVYDSISNPFVDFSSYT